MCISEEKIEGGGVEVRGERIANSIWKKISFGRERKRISKENEVWVSELVRKSV